MQRDQAAPTSSERKEEGPARVRQVRVHAAVASGARNEVCTDAVGHQRIHQVARGPTWPQRPRWGGDLQDHDPPTTMLVPGWRVSGWPTSGSASCERIGSGTHDHRKVALVHVERRILEESEGGILCSLRLNAFVWRWPDQCIGAHAKVSKDDRVD